MELTINVAEITDLVIQDSDGKRYLIIEEGAAYDVLEQVKDATAERTKTLLTQRELMCKISDGLGVDINYFRKDEENEV